MMSINKSHVMVNECVLCETKRSRVMLSHTQYSVSMTTVCVNTNCMYRNESHYRVKPKTSSHSKPIKPAFLLPWKVAI